MPRRIEIELTSRTGDGAFTWRAAGARQPRGTVATELLPDGVAIGDVVRAEVESGLEGLEVVAVLASPGKADERPANRIEVIGTPQRGPDVLVSYASGRPRRDREDGERGGGRRAPRGPRTRRAPGDAPSDLRPSRARRDRPVRGDRTETNGDRARPRSDERRIRADRDDRSPRGERMPRAERMPQGARMPRDDRMPRGERTPGGRDRDAHTAGDRGAAAERRSPRPERRDAPPARRERRPTVSTTHRNSLLANLGPQELPIAEQLLRGGMPAVRQALAEQHAARPGDAAAEGNRDAVISIAEQLLPRVNLAGWKDRAASAQVAGKELRLRELRAVVTAARTVTLDEEGRAMSRALHESLDQRVRSLREEWVGRMTKALDDGRVADAVRVSARAPEPATRLPAELAVRLAESASQAMTAGTPPGEWIALLGAVVESPVRRNVKPSGIPDDDQAKDAARRAAGFVPELARLLGLRIPPPPPRRPARSGPSLMAAGGAGSAGGR